MKRTLVFAIAMLLTGGASLAGAVTANLEWDPPTHRIAQDSCSVAGVALTPAEVTALQYTVSYRVKGAATWQTLEVGSPRAALTGLPYGTAYEVRAVAHLPGETGLCPSDVFEFNTGAGPAPGGCQNMRVTIAP